MDFGPLFIPKQLKLRIKHRTPAPETRNVSTLTNLDPVGLQGYMLILIVIVIVKTPHGAPVWLGPSLPSSSSRDTEAPALVTVFGWIYMDLVGFGLICYNFQHQVGTPGGAEWLDSRHSDPRPCYLPSPFSQLPRCGYVKEQPVNRHPELRKPESVPASSRPASGRQSTLANHVIFVNNKNHIVY